jgi:hypothetical protein
MQKVLAFFCVECSRWMTSDNATEHRELNPAHRLLHRDVIERRAQRRPADWVKIQDTPLADAAD